MSALVADDGWQRRHDLVFELELHRAECEFLTGDMAAAEQHLSDPLVARGKHGRASAVACLLADVYLALQQARPWARGVPRMLAPRGARDSAAPDGGAGASCVRRDLSKLDGVGIDEARRAAVDDRSDVARNPRCAMRKS